MTQALLRASADACRGSGAAESALGTHLSRRALLQRVIAVPLLAACAVPVSTVPPPPYRITLSFPMTFTHIYIDGELVGVWDHANHGYLTPWGSIVT